MENTFWQAILGYQLLFAHQPPALANELQSAIEQALKDMDLGFYHNEK